MKVLHVINNLHREGAQVVVSNLVTAGTADDVRHAVFSRTPGGALRDELSARGVPVHAPDRYYPARQLRHTLRWLERVIRAEAVDLLHAHMADAAVLAWLAARRHALPLVITHHGHDLLPRCSRVCRAVYRLLLGRAARYARCNAAVSVEVAGSVRRILRVDERRVGVLENGVPVPPRELLPIVRDSLSDAPRIVSVGRLVQLKGQDQLLTAATLLAADFPRIQFVIVGDGPLRAALQQQADALGLTHHVTFTGSVRDVPAQLRAADIYVSTSHYEGMPMATLEAMAWGVPVVASDVPGNRAVVEHGRTGLLFQSGDSAGLAAQLRAVMADPVAAAARAATARDRVERQYSADAVARGYRDIYVAALGPTPARAAL